MTDETDDERLRELFAEKPFLRDNETFVAGVMANVQRERARLRERAQLLATALAILTLAFALPRLDQLGASLQIVLAEMLPALPPDPTLPTLVLALIVSAGGYLVAERA